MTTIDQWDTGLHESELSTTVSLEVGTLVRDALGEDWVVIETTDTRDGGRWVHLRNADGELAEHTTEPTDVNRRTWRVVGWPDDDNFND